MDVEKVTGVCPHELARVVRAAGALRRVSDGKPSARMFTEQALFQAYQAGRRRTRVAEGQLESLTISVNKAGATITYKFAGNDTEGSDQLLDGEGMDWTDEELKEDARMLLGLDEPDMDVMVVERDE